MPIYALVGLAAMLALIWLVLLPDWVKMWILSWFGLSL